MPNGPQTVPPNEPKQSPAEGKGDFIVKVYLNDAREREEFIRLAEDGGFRRRGLPTFIKKPHGFEHEHIANTDGISTFLKDCARKRAATLQLSAALRLLL
jgi:hypothetical protein